MWPFPVNQVQMPCILLHPLLDLGQYIYIKRQMDPQSIKHICIEYQYTSCGPLQSIEHRCFPYHYTQSQIQDNTYIQNADGPPSHLSIDVLHTITLHVALPSQSSRDALHTATPLLDLGQCIYIKRQMDPQSIKHICIEYQYTSCGPLQSIEHRCFAYHYTQSQIQDNTYIQNADGPPSHLSIDALNIITLHVALPSQSRIDTLHTTKPSARSRTMHIYRMQLDPHVNQGQMPYILLHPLLDLGQCIYIEGRWTPISKSSIDALNTATPNILAQHNAIQHRSSPVS